MADINLTQEQLANLLEKAITAGVAAATAMNPLEKKAYEEQLKKEKRRAFARRGTWQGGSREEISPANGMHSLTRQAERVACGAWNWSLDYRRAGDGLRCHQPSLLAVQYSLGVQSNPARAGICEQRWTVGLPATAN